MTHVHLLSFTMYVNSEYVEAKVIDQDVIF